MQRGCMQRNSRKEGTDFWQFRWSETRLDGKRLYYKKLVGTVEQYPDEDAARRSVVGLVSELNTLTLPDDVLLSTRFAYSAFGSLQVRIQACVQGNSVRSL
jgi:hypothetical protein